MASAIPGLGLGINFNPPPSPPERTAAAAAINPAISRLQGQTALGRKGVLPPSVILSRRTASANNVDDPRRRRQQEQSYINDGNGDNDQEDEALDTYGNEVQYDERLSPPTSGGARRKVRIVSAANTYHEQYISSSESSPAIPGDASYHQQDDILDDYASSSSPALHNDAQAYDDHDEEESYEAQESIIYPSLSDPSPAPTMRTTLSSRSTGAVSSGSSTRFLDALEMAHPQHLPDPSNMTNKVMEFEARLRDMHIQDDYQSSYPSIYEQRHSHNNQAPSLKPGHARSYTVDEILPISEAVATIRGNLPTSNSGSNLTSRVSGLRRAGAMSRPKSMMELNQLYTAASHADVDELRKSIRDPGYQALPSHQHYHLQEQAQNQQPLHHHHQDQQFHQQAIIMAVPMQSQLSTQTTASTATTRFSANSPAVSMFSESAEGGYASSAPSSVAGGSGEPKPVAVFMDRQSSSSVYQTQQQQPSHHPHHPQHLEQQRHQSTSYMPSSVVPSNNSTPQTQAAHRQHQIRKVQSAITMRSQASMRGLEEAENGGAAVVLDSLGKTFVQGVPLDPRHAGQLGEDAMSATTGGAGGYKPSANAIFGSEELMQGSLLMAHRPDEAASASGQQDSRKRSASIATTKTSSSSGHSSNISSSSRPSSVLLAKLPSTQGLPSLTGQVQPLQRQSTLLSANGNPLKRAKELDRLLDPKPTPVRSHYSPTVQPYNSNDMPSRAVFGGDEHGDANGPATAEGGVRRRSSGITSFHPHGAVLPSTQLKRKPSTVVLEQSAKGKARVEMDLTLAGTMVVEGGKLKGRMEIRVRKEKAGEGEVWLGAVKARIVGFEELAGEDARHVFYHHSVNIEHVPSSSSTDAQQQQQNKVLPCYASEPDGEGFCKGKTGNHTFPFEMHLPVGKGAKGSWKGKAGVVKYIVIGSIKLKSHIGLDRSIAHFYRHVDVFPYLNPSIVLAPAISPLRAETSKALFMGGSGKVYLKASLHRPTWVAGQRCYASLHVKNEASKKIKTLTLALIRTTTVFRPKPHLTAGNGFDENDPVYADVDQDACSTQTMKKKIAETSLEMGKKSARGTVTAKGMWLGVEPGEEAEFCHFLEVPSDALTIERGRYLEISYALKVSVTGSLSSDVSVEIPCRIINFVSIDPPPGHPGPLPLASDSAGSNDASSHKAMTRAWSTDVLRTIAKDGARTSQQQAGRAGMARMTSMDSLNIHDLNNIYGSAAGQQGHMARQHSYNSQISSTSASTASTGVSMARSFTMPGNLQMISENKQDEMQQIPQSHSSIENVQPEIRRQIRHQMSLDCIGSAIASATARKAVHQRAHSGLSIGYSADVEQISEQAYDDDTESLPYLQHQQQQQYEQGVQLDELDDIPEDGTIASLPRPQPALLQHGGAQYQPNQVYMADGTPYSYSEHVQLHENDYAEYEDESEDEVDLVLEAKQYESDEDAYQYEDSSIAAASPAKASKAAPPKSPSVPRRPVSSILTASAAPSQDGTTTSRPGSSLGSSRMSFGVASPASPVKKSYTPITSPPRRNTKTMPINASRSPRFAAAISTSPGSNTGSSAGFAGSLRTTTRLTGSFTSTSDRRTITTRLSSNNPSDGSTSPVKRQQVERVPGPLSTPSVMRTQPMKGAMRKMASTPSLRTSGMA